MFTSGNKKLTKSFGSGIPTRVLYFDTETRAVKVPSGENHYLRLGWSCSCRYRADGECDRTVWRSWTKGKEFCDYVESIASPKNPLYIFAHNVFFDLQVVGFFKYLARDGWTLNFYYDKGLTYILIVEKEHAQIKCVSTTNIYDCSLRSLGEMLGLPKLDVAFDRATDDELSIYCHRDVEIVKGAMEKYFHFLIEHDLGKFCCAKAAQAMRTYRHRFMNVPIYIHDSQEVQELERKSYFGGRVECFQLGHLTDGPFVTLDVNSMYPYVMKKYFMPVRLVDYRHEIDLELLKGIVDRFCVVARVDLVTEAPIYPLRVHNKAVYPIGTFEATLTTPGIKTALQKGHIVKVHEIAVYERDHIFTEYIDFFYRLKAQYHREKRGVERELAKKLLNCLYGKWSQRRPIIEQNISTSYDGYFREEVYDVVSGKTELTYKMFNRIVTIYGDEQDRRSFVAISSHITEAARIELWKIIETVGVNDVIYCDTDSVKIRKCHVPRLEHLLSEDRLGYLKIEEESETLDIFGLKSYVMNGKRRLKGIPKSAQTSDGKTFTYQQFVKQATHMRKRLDEGFLVREVQKTLTGVYDKGIVTASGRVVPFVYGGTPLPHELSPE